MDITTRIDIARPVQEVFAFVNDQTNAPQWQKGLHEVRRLTDGPIGVGTEHDIVRTFAGRRLVMRNRYVAFEPGRYVQFEIPSGRMTGRASYRTEANPSGGTMLTTRLEFRVHGFLSLLDPVLARILTKDLQRNMQRLKSLLEQGSPSVPA